MLSQADIIAKLRDAEPELRQRGVEGLYLFGSYARGNARPDSDIDLFFDHRDGLGLEAISLMDDIKRIALERGDVTTRRSLHPMLRDDIENSAVRVF